MKAGPNSEIGPVIKVILLGESGVGKTSIINRYINDNFNPNSEITFSPSFSTKKIIKDEILYKLNLWDTTGQEKYHSVTNIFIKEQILLFWFIQ